MSRWSIETGVMKVLWKTPCLALWGSFVSKPYHTHVSRPDKSTPSEQSAFVFLWGMGFWIFSNCTAAIARIRPHLCKFPWDLYVLCLSSLKHINTHTNTHKPCDHLNLNHNTQSQHTCTPAKPFNTHARPQGPQIQLTRNVSYICGNGGTVSLSAVLTLDKHTRN